MKKSKNNQDYPVPSAELVLDLIRSAPETDNKFLSFYNLYIGKAAVEPVYADDGCCCGTRLNEDLRQEILITFVQSLIPLRRKLIRYLNGECVLVLIVPPPVS
ncbi:MAG TPA: helix-turn-helix domain-containing protein [Firmicutes bacterium]|nr:helix-turn-helix domain-containing protein [Bacillota bacterium]